MSNDQALIERASRLFSAGRYAEAEGLYQQMLEAEPGNHQVLMLLGLCRRGQGDLPGAMEWLDRAASHGDDNPECHFYRGRVLMESGKPEASREALSSCLALNPNHAPARTLDGYIAFVSGQAEQAVEILRTALRAGPKYAPAMSTLALALLALGRVDEAHDAAGRAVKIAPDDAGAQSALGRVFMAQGHHAFAEQALANALKKHPQNPELKAGLAAARAALGRHAEAITLYREALSAGYGGAALARDLATSLAATGQNEAARQLLGQVMARQPDDHQSALQLAEYHLLAGDVVSAAGLLDKLPEDDVSARLLRARVAEADYRTEEVMQLIRGLDGHDDPAVRRQARILAGRVALVDRDLPAAREALEPLIQDDPPDPAAAMQLYQVAEACGETAAGCQVLEDLLSRGQLSQDQKGRVHELLAGLFDRRENHAQAAGHLQGGGWRPAPVLEQAASDAADRARAPWLTTEELEWPDEDIEDAQPDPVIVLGWPGSGRELLLPALAAHDLLPMLDPNRVAARVEALGLPLSPEEAAQSGSPRLRAGRRRFMRGLGAEHIGLVLEPGWWDSLAVAGLARFFPGARVIVMSAAPADLELHWRFSGLRNVATLLEAWEKERALFNHLRERLPLEFNFVSRKQLLAEPDQAIESLCDWLGLTPIPAMRQAFDLERERQALRPDGHWKHYRELLACVRESSGNDQ